MTRHRPHKPRPSRIFKLPAGFVCKRGGITCPYCQKQFSTGHQVSGHLATCKAGHAYLLGRIPSSNDPILILEEDAFNDYLLNMSFDFQEDEIPCQNALPPPLQCHYYEQ